MIIEKKQIGSRKDSKGNNKPVWAPDIPAELEGKISPPKYNPETGDYTSELTAAAQLEQLKQELRAETDDRITEIADLIETGIQGKELADAIRNANSQT